MTKQISKLDRAGVKKKYIAVLLFGLLSLILGFLAGFLVWVVLKILAAGTEFVWTFLPERLQINRLVFNIIVCTIGAVLIFWFRKKCGPLPDTTEEVMEKIKKTGKYPYNNLGAIAIMALLPLIFGGTLGPEAGLVGFIAGLCCWVGDNLKYRGQKLTALTETGLSVALSVVFRSPIFGIAENLEPNDKKEHYGDKLFKKRHRIFVYIMGVVGAIIAMQLATTILTALLPDFPVGGLPRFSNSYSFDFSQLLWLIPLVVIGVVLGLFYKGVDFGTKKIAVKLDKYPFIPILIAGFAVAVCGFFLPDTMFSGEHQLEPLISNWQSYDAGLLLLTGVVKLALVSVCINFAWRGGSIFPIIFGSAAVGFAFALFCGIDGPFAAIMTIAATYAYISRKPVATLALLLLCAPLVYIVPVLITAFIAAKIPQFELGTSSKKEKSSL